MTQPMPTGKTRTVDRYGIDVKQQEFIVSASLDENGRKTLARVWRDVK